jgi:hypothetical protein
MGMIDDIAIGQNEIARRFLADLQANIAKGSANA